MDAYFGKQQQNNSRRKLSKRSTSILFFPAVYLFLTLHFSSSCRLTLLILSVHNPLLDHLNRLHVPIVAHREARLLFVAQCRARGRHTLVEALMGRRGEQLLHGRLTGVLRDLLHHRLSLLDGQVVHIRHPGHGE